MGGPNLVERKFFRLLAHFNFCCGASLSIDKYIIFQCNEIELAPRFCARLYETLKPLTLERFHATIYEKSLFRILDYDKTVF